ncbi:MAG: orotate phosphoribosyltransferase [Myxococcota bacterium]
MNKLEVIGLLFETGAVELRSDPDQWFTWTSGKRAPIYCDNRVLISYPYARTRVSDALAQEIRSGFRGAQVIAGTATAGIPFAAWVAERLNLPMVYVRGAAKEHGQGRRVEGRPLEGERVVVVEDLVSLGGSALDTVQALQEEGGKVIGVQAIFSYGFPEAARRFKAAAVPLQALTDYEALIESMDLDAATARVLLDWRAD